MARKLGPGKCVHCCEEVKTRTWDHVFPKGWYPDDTPNDIEKWKIPTCKPCNAEYGAIEEDLGICIALCLGPEAPNAKGLYKKALRSMDASKGRNYKDKVRRSKKRDKYLRLFMKGDDIPQEAVYPGFEERWGRPKEEQVALPISANGLRRIVEKIIKGIAFIEDEVFLDETMEIEHHVVSEDSAFEFEAALERFGNKHSRGPGIEVIRAVVQDDRVSSIYKITIWGQWVMYASVMPKGAQQEPQPESASKLASPG